MIKLAGEFARHDIALKRHAPEASYEYKENGYDKRNEQTNKEPLK
jgi:hypothetical protein